MRKQRLHEFVRVGGCDTAPAAWASLPWRRGPHRQGDNAGVYTDWLKWPLGAVLGRLCTLLRHCVSTRRGKRRAIRRVLSVVEIEHEYFIVVLEENGDAYRFRTAFPSNKEYYDHRVRDQGVNSGIWGNEK